MYHNSPPTDYVAIIGGIISLIVIITFFVMASRLKSIMESTGYLQKYVRKQALSKEYVRVVKCPTCSDPFELWDNEPDPEFCSSCRERMKPKIAPPQA
jgi:hypothetical protein